MQTFNEKCYALLRKVPKGKLTTYRDLAHALNTCAYRAVGNAMNKNPHLISTPCHRVVGVNGDLVGFAKGLAMKKKLLLKEGIEIKNNKVVELKKYLYKFQANSIHLK